MGNSGQIDLHEEDPWHWLGRPEDSREHRTHKCQKALSVVSRVQVGDALSHSLVKGKAVVWEIRQTWILILALSLLAV